MFLLRSLSRAIARIETFLGATLGALVMGLILLNVITRTMGNALFWVDEAAITAMVWMTFFGTSVALHHRESVAVTLLPDLLPDRTAFWIGRAVDLVVLVFCAILLVLAWNWYDPLTLARVGFDTRAFSGETFNFIYAETSTTLGIRKFWLWLIVPIFALNATLHTLCNLLTPAPVIRPDTASAAADPAAAR